jgi:SAM-dependent methyltransferase
VGASTDHAAHNDAVWRRGAWLKAYDSDVLHPAERVLLDRYAGPLAGRVLELGPGAGRVTVHLARRASELTAWDLSPAMVQACRARVPAATTEVRDLRAVATLPDAALEAVVASCNVLDVLGDDERRDVLAHIARALAPGGVLLFSSHNRDGAHRRPWPPTTRSARTFAGEVARMPRSLRNHHSLRHLEREADGYALRNDQAHAFSMVLYVITAPAQRTQLQQAGLTLQVCLTDAGDEVDVGGPPSTEPYLHYAAAR